MNDFHTKTSGTFPVVALSQVDRIYPNFPEEDVDLSQEIRRAAKFLDISENFIVPIVNLTHGRRDFVTESRLYDLLQKACSQAAAKCLSYSIEESERKKEIQKKF
jgi:hypothetical protein